MTDDDDRPDDDGGGDDWEIGLTAESTRADVERAIVQSVRTCLDDFREQLARDPDLSPDERTRAIAFAEPRCRRLTRQCFEDVWAALRPVH